MIVNVHRNLTWSGGRGFSVLDQNMILIDRKLFVHIYTPRFVVHPSGQARAVASGHRNVHAFVRGELGSKHDTRPSFWPCYGLTALSYNPFDTLGFVDPDGNEVWNANHAWLFGGGVYVR